VEVIAILPWCERCYAGASGAQKPLVPRFAPVVGVGWIARRNAVLHVFAMDETRKARMPGRRRAPSRAVIPSGFTLVEVMVAVAVFVILATIAVPGFSDYLDTARLRGAADAVVDAHAQARMGAVMQARRVVVRTMGEGLQWCVGAREGAACDCMAMPEACVVDARSVVVSGARHPGVVLLAPTEDIAFDGRTGMRGVFDPVEPLRLVSRSGRHAMSVAVSPMGQATMCSHRGVLLGVRAC
jgi:prepilin-type N-terminal cleavage/methylation domain-containing protein